jgi:WD40 repeat protein
MDRVKEFLESEQQQVFLLLGDSGAGKSTFNKALECTLWDAYKKKDGMIPLYINLPTIDKPDQDMVTKHLRRLDFTDAQIKELKDHRKLVLICDGYDESQQTKNLYIANQLNQPDEWQAKMVISCRSEYIGADYRDRFQPGDRNQLSKAAQFREAVFIPFSTSQVDEYIDQYVSLRQPLWRADDYKQALSSIPSLKELVRNPFLMTLSLEVLPRMMDPGERLSVNRVTRVLLYDQFIEQWLERGKRRLGEKELSATARAAFDSLSDEGFAVNGIDFLKRLSMAIYKEQDGQPVVEYSRFRDEGSWKRAFFSRDDETYLLREACPLTKNGNQYRFIHRSMLEYGLARAIFDPQEHKQSTILQPSLNRRGSTSSAWSFEVDGDLESVGFNNQEPDINSPLLWRSLVNELSLLQFLEERVHQEPVFKQQLLDYIKYSKMDKKWRTAAANAITILVRAGVVFRRADLQGIRIPGADLSHGVFDSTNLQGADLRKANLGNASFRGSDLSGSDMKDAQFGELPFLKYDDMVLSSMYSPEGSSIAVSLFNGNIEVYATSNWERTWILSGHGDGVGSIAYSPNGDRIVSGSFDTTVRVWDVATGDCLYIFSGHTNEVQAVAYSPQGNVVASRSGGGTVRLWDLESGDCRSIISDCGFTLDMAFSPKGDTIALGSKDHRVRLWDVGSGEFRSILIGHTRWVKNVAYSAQGHFISKDYDQVVKVWRVETGECRHTLQANADGAPALSPKGNQMAFYGRWLEEIELWDLETGACVHRILSRGGGTSSIAFSPQGDQIATGDGDKAVRLWDLESWECRHTMTGNSNNVDKVLFSPKGDYIASVGRDNTVRLWNVGSGTSQTISNYHGDGVLSLQYSPKRNQVVSGSKDTTIGLWDVEAGVCRRKLTGHSMKVVKVLYSPQEDHLVSCSEDKTVRLWDVESGACLRVLTGHTNIILDVGFSPLGDQVASASCDKTVRLWNVNTGECQHVLTGHSDEVWVLVYSPQGNQVASTCVDGTMRLWDVNTGACQHVLTGHSERIEKIEYSPNGHQIASASTDMTVRLWDVRTGMCSHIFIGHQETLKRVVYSPRGDQVASTGTYEDTVRLWDTESGECRHVLKANHKKSTDAIAYSPRGNLIASWGDWGEGRLWDVETGECHWILNYDESAQSGAFTYSQPFVWMPDGDSFITGDGNGSVRMWDVIKEGDRYRVHMRWRSINGQLTVEKASIQDVQGLSSLNKRLLVQRGAIGEPNIRLR